MQYVQTGLDKPIKWVDKSSMKKKIIIGVVLLVVCVAGFVACRNKSGSDDESVTVRVQEIVPGKLSERVTAPGYIEPWRKVGISARVSARIAELPFDEGAEVKEGDLLVRLDSTDMQAQLDSAQARRAAQEAQIEVGRIDIEGRKIAIEGIGISLEQAQRQLARRQMLLETGDVTESEVEDLQTRVDELNNQLSSSRNSMLSAETNLKVLEGNLRAADAEIDRAKDSLSYATILSPINGIVTQLKAEVGEIAMTGTMNNPGTMILEVADLSKMLLAAQVDEADVDKVKAGQKVEVKIQALPDEIFESSVENRSLVLLADQMGTRSCRIEVLLDNPGHRILSGMAAEVEILVEEHQDVLTVPSQAIQGCEFDNLPKEIREEDAQIDRTKSIIPVVYKHINGEAIVKPVVIGTSDLHNTIVLEGLEEGDLVITGPFKELEKLSHKKKVALEATPAAAAAAAEPTESGE